jgi:hypothetical protein
MEAILNNKLRQERVVEPVEKGQEVKEEEMKVVAGNVNGEYKNNEVLDSPTL